MKMFRSWKETSGIILVLLVATSIPTLSSAEEDGEARNEPEPLILEESGLRQLNEIPAPVTREELASAFPGYRVRIESIDVGEGYFVDKPVLYKNRDRALVITLDESSGEVMALSVYTSEMKTSHGVRVGGEFRTALELHPMECFSYAESNHGKILCRDMRYLEWLQLRHRQSDEPVPPYAGSAFSYIIEEGSDDQKECIPNYHYCSYEPSSLAGNSIEAIHWSVPPSD